MSRRRSRRFRPLWGRLRPPEPPVAELAQLVREAQSGQRIPSISAAAVGNGQVVWQEALGVASVEDGVDADPNTQYRVGSITKTFTAAAVMQLRDAGLLDLDDPLERHVPGARHGQLTLRRMLTHLSGLQRELPGYVWETLEFPDREGLVAGLVEAGVSVDLEQVETNFVQIDVGPDRAGAIERIKNHGVLVSTTVHPTIVRAVAHLDISDDDVERAIEAIPAALTRTAALRAR